MKKNNLVEESEKKADDLANDLKKSHDLLEQKVIEKTVQLEQMVRVANGLAIKLEEANKAKTTFLRNINHELRTPLSGFISMTDFLLQTQLTERQRNYANKIMISGQNLLATISDVLDFSKIDAGKLSITSECFSTRELLISAIETFEPKISAKELSFAVNINDIDVFVRGDRDRIIQVLNNLFSNAIKFTKNGRIEIRAAILSRTSTTIKFKVSIRDTGIGIKEEDLSKLFNPFYQVDDSISRSYGGSGLGLAISKNLIELMGGKIEVQSVYGEGSCFTITMDLIVALEAA